MAKRGDRVAPPARSGQWELRFATADAATGWEQLCKQSPGPTREAYDVLSADPRDRSRPDRLHPLKGSLGAREIHGKQYEQWQFEVTGAGRIWYCIDDAARRVLLTLASTGHPRETE